MSREIREREQWFIDRIGRTVYRNEDSCSCPICKNVYDNGLIVHDQYHASYLYEIELSYNADGFPLKYFDTKAEVLAFENSIQNDNLPRK